MRVVDNGRGIPVGIVPSESKPAVEVVLTVLHAGGKFGGGGYAVSGGLHGVGVSVVNALSTRVAVEVRTRRLPLDAGLQAAASRPRPLAKNEATDETGTTVTFWADADIFETTEYSFETLVAALPGDGLPQQGPDHLRSRTSASRRRPPSVPTTPRRRTRSRRSRTVTYHYEGGIVDFVKYLNSRKGEPIHPTVIDFEAEDKERMLSVEIAMQWNTQYTEGVYSFANTIHTHEGGTHEEGFRAALTDLVNRYARDKKLLREKDDNLTGEDIREGLTAIISVKLGEPQFEGQTKTKLGNTEAKTFVQKVVHEHLNDWFDRNPNEAADIIRKSHPGGHGPRRGPQGARPDPSQGPAGVGVAAGQADATASRTTRRSARSSSSRVTPPAARPSPAATRSTRRSCPIRGKILNVEKARIDKILQNNEVQALISAFGTGVHEDFDIEKLRYHKIILMADADVDGQHINTLLLTFLFRFMRPLVEAGHVYLSPPAALQDQVGPGRLRVRVLRPRARRADRARHAERQARPREDSIQRFKGLGEMNAEELRVTTMDPDHRVLGQVTLDDAAQADDLFSVLMGEDVEARRSFIQRNAKDVRFLDI